MAKPPAQEPNSNVKPELAEGDLVKVAVGENQTEAEFLQSLLLDAGVPSVLRRARGFDVPDFLAAGPRDVLVPASGVEVAREVLGPIPQGTWTGDSPLRVLAGVALAVVVVAVLVWLGTELFV
jgi:hypothetical protein